MAVKIQLSTSIVIPGMTDDQVTLPEGITTLRSLLKEAGRRINYDIISNDSGDLEEDFEILINGKEVWFHPGGLDTPLQDNDAVEIHIVGLGGG